jgi:hypothetical protein
VFASFQPELLRSAYDSYSTTKGRNALDRECGAKVVESRWATGDMAFAYSLGKPFVKELYRVAPKWLKPGAVPKYGNVRHELDGQGVIHVVVDPSFGEKAMNEKQGTRTYLVYGEGQIEAITYRSGHVELLRRCVREGDRLVREHVMGRRHGSESLYVWLGDHLARCATLGWNHSYNSASQSWGPLETTSRTEERFEYDALDRLQRVVERSLNDDGTVDKGLETRVRYVRPEKAESLANVTQEIERLLLEQVPATAAQARGKGPFSALLLCYCGEDFPAGWPPYLLLVSDAERQRVIARGHDVTYDLWAPGEMEDRESNIRLPLKDEVLNNYCRLHIQLMDARSPDARPTEQAKTYAAARKTIRNVAKALNEREWSAIFDVTPDFLVAPVDDHGETSPAEDIKAVIPAANFRALRENGLI